MTDADALAHTLNAAVTHHQTGNLTEAERLYRQILEHDPDQSDALNLLGVITAQSGDLDLALGLFDRASTAAPNIATIPYNKANALRDAGRHEDARHAYETALSIDPDYTDARLNLGALLHEGGKPEAAIAHFNILLEQVPDMAQGHYNLGKCRQTQGRMDDAKAALEKAIALNPNDPNAHLTLANVLADMGVYDDAVKHIQVAIKINPNWAEAYTNWGKFLCDQDQFKAGLEKYDLALALDPDNANAQVNRGLALLSLGNLQEGWNCYKHRARSDAPFFKDTEGSVPVWTDQNLADKHVLVEGEQGLGDEILFASMLREFAGLTRRCTVSCSKKLIPVFRQAFYDNPKIDICDRQSGGVTSDSFDLRTTYIDIGAILRPSLGDFPKAKPFLAPDSQRTDDFRQRYRSTLGQDALFVGLSWASGNPDIGPTKSIPLPAWEGLLTCPGVRFISLQPDAAERDFRKLSEHQKQTIYVDPEIDPYNDLDAALCQIGAMDLIITCSNTIAHLSGACGKPTRLIVPYGRARIWYWFTSGENSPWYKDFSLQRRRPGETWSHVMDRAAQDLSQFTKENR